MPPSRRQTESFKRLRKNLGRGATLLNKFFDMPGGKPRAAGQPKSHEQELLRAVLVLGIGSLDAFLSELLIELLPRIATAAPDAAVFDRIAKDSPGLVLRALYLGSPDRDAALADAIEAHFQAKVMHGSKSVMQVSDWCVLGLRGDDFNSTQSPQTFQNLDNWTNSRHRIVHRGELVRLTRSKTGELIEVVESVGKVLNDRAIDVLY